MRSKNFNAERPVMAAHHYRDRKDAITKRRNALGLPDARKARAARRRAKPYIKLTAEQKAWIAAGATDGRS